MPRLTVLACLAALSCVPAVESTNVATSDIRATLRVSATGDGTTYAEAIFQIVTMPGSYLQIAEDETLEITLGDTTLPFVQETEGVIVYSAVFDDDPPNDPFTFAYTRAVWPSTSSTVALPPMADAITVGSSFGPNNVLPVTWGATLGRARLTVSGDCIETWGTEVSLEVGSYDIPGGAVSARPDTGSCAVNVQLYAENEGVIDEAFDDQSSIQGRAWRSAASTYNP